MTVSPRRFNPVNSRFRALGAVLLSFCLFIGIARSAQELPTYLSDEVFWKLVTEFSEEGGYFLSDNFVSNERMFQHVLSDLTLDREPGGAYLGVGPEQNFTYIVALKPKIAFIFDIRRQNMIQHLMYKVVFELSADRAEFLSLLFSRPKPSNLSSDAGIVELFDAFRDVAPDAAAYRANLAAIENRLTQDHGFTLSPEDEENLDHVYGAFYLHGPTLAYSRSNRPGIMPSFEELMTEVDQHGDHRSYLATEENYASLRELQANNLVIPLVGDFAGSTAIRAVGDYLKEHNTRVAAFYTSNVEQYLFRSDNNWKRFYTNVAALPLEGRSVFIRAMVKTRGGQFSAVPIIRPGSYLENGLYPISDLVSAFELNMIRNYYDILYGQNLPDVLNDQIPQ